MILKIAPLLDGIYPPGRGAFYDLKATPHGQIIALWSDLGFSATNDIFTANAWYFRNALVRANYTNLQKGIHETTEFLELFLRNLLLGEANELHNRSMHISELFQEKVDIQERKEDISEKKVDIRGLQDDVLSGFSEKTAIHVRVLYEKYGNTEVFGRADVIAALWIKESGASKFLSNLLKVGIIEPVAGQGKGRYKFG